jgi:hypothetical protein
MIEPVQVAKPRKAEHEEEQAYMKGHRILMLEMRETDTFLSRKDRQDR